MLTLQHIHKSFADKVVLEGVSLSVNAGEVVALIGENGAGKTTLLEIIMGIVKPDSGTLMSYKEGVGYVPQSLEVKGAILDEFSQVEKWKAEYALSIVGLKNISENQKVANLSGGQQTRLAFARILAAETKPTLLLLDEPTNNLDADGLVWLKQFIKDFSGGILLASHDRNFINNVATHVAELHKGKLNQYKGNYDTYKKQKEIEYQTEHANYENNLEERKRLEKAMRLQNEKSQHTHKHIKRSDNDKFQRDFFRNRVASKFGQNAKMLQSRLEQLEDAKRPETNKNYKISLSGNVSPTKLILRCENVSKKYGYKSIAYPDFEIRGTQRLQVKGINGSGKTTLLKIAAGLIAHDGGSTELGQDIRFGYFSQDVSGLEYDLSNFQNLAMSDADTTAIYREARSLGLDENELRKKPDELSRGQQAKLSFAKLLLSKNNLLILDEPTNHLDLPTREKIEAALQQYEGAMLITSHDEYFVNNIQISQEISLGEGVK